jgi:hypothetical protein
MSQADVTGILRGAGLLAITIESDYREVLRAVVNAARMVSQAYVNDRAMVYNDLCRRLDAIGLEAPWSTEDYFFNWEETHGKIAAQERTRLRAADRQVAEQAGRHDEGGAEPERDQGWERGGRSRAVVVEPVTDMAYADDPGEEPEAAEPLESDGRSTISYDVPF